MDSIAAPSLATTPGPGTGAGADRFQVGVALEIRPAEAEDLPALEWMGLFARHRPTIEAAFAAQARGEGLMLLAVAAGFPLGQAWLDFTRCRVREAALLWAVRTFPPLQGAGIGARLVRRAEGEARARGLRRAELVVERGNPSARRFYERLGWQVVGPARETVRFLRDDGSEAREALEGWRMATDLVPPGMGLPRAG